jgi:hypothetical protein
VAARQGIPQVSLKTTPGHVGIAWTEFKKPPVLDVVVHVYNPSYKGGRNWEDGGSRPAWAKKKENVSKTPSQQKLGVVVCACVPATQAA